MKMKLSNTVYFYINYFLSKVVFMWWEVKTSTARLFLCELIYSFGKIFRYYTDFSSSIFGVDFYGTRFGKFNIRRNTMDVVSASPAFERPDILYMQKLLKKQMDAGRHITFVDVGADFGSYTVMTGNFFKRNRYKNADIYSFEPTRSSYDLLLKNIRSNNLQDFSIKTFNCGLSFENNDSIPILFNEEDPGSTSIKDIKRDSRIIHRQRKEIISVKALDTMNIGGDFHVSPGVLFMKIDVEGYETHVLEGGLNTVKDGRYSDVYVMVEDSIDDSVAQFLRQQGFHCLGKYTPYNSWWSYHSSLPQISEEKQPLVSVIIVNWNGKKWLKQCFDSLYNQTMTDFEIIFVDNASSDDSVSYVSTQYPKARIVQSGGNIGFSGGNNLGVRYARGKYVVFLNNDTWVDQNYLEKFIVAFDEIPNLGSAQSKIVLMNDENKLDACGAYWSHSSFLYHYGYAKDQSNEKYNVSKEIFSNKGASMIVRRDLIEKIGLFDEEFWCYYEETDFCHRVWLSGYECWYYPKATIHHAIGGTSTYFENSHIQFHNLKNKLRSYLKNLQLRTLFIILPIFFLLNFGLGLFLLLRGKSGQCTVLFKALSWNIRNFRETIVERKKIQAQRVRTDKQIFTLVRREPSLTYYYHLLFGLEKYEDRI